MKDIVKLLNALSLEGFKAAKDFAATKKYTTPLNQRNFEALLPMEYNLGRFGI